MRQPPDRLGRFARVARRVQNRDINRALTRRAGVRQPPDRLGRFTTVGTQHDCHFIEVDRRSDHLIFRQVTALNDYSEIRWSINNLYSNGLTYGVPSDFS